MVSTTLSTGTRRRVCGLAGLLAALWAGPVLAADPPAADAALATLRPELQADKTLYRPDGPIRIRCTLVNTADTPTNVALESAVPLEDGIALPLPLVVGAGESTPLTIVYENDDPKPLIVATPPTAAPKTATGATAATLRLAAHASVGLELDFRSLYPASRYSGTYRLEWRPLGGQVGMASVQFRVEPRKDAILVTDLGKLTFVLDYDGAPRNVENFLELVGQGFYDGKTIHRIIPGGGLQGGCPKGDGTGIRLDGRLVPAELRNVPVDIGTLLMARKPSDPNSASCQFFVALARKPEFDGQYTVIGNARDDESLRTLQQFAAVPTNARGAPLKPLIIRSINLVDAEQERGKRLELQPQRASSPPPSKPAPAPKTEPAADAADHPPADKPQP